MKSGSTHRIPFAPRWSLWKVQVTVSAGATSMFDTGLPSSQVALASCHPDGRVCEIE